MEGTICVEEMEKWDKENDRARARGRAVTHGVGGSATPNPKPWSGRRGPPHSK